MPSLKLLLNIGTSDAKALGLKSASAGDTVDVDDDAAEELVSRGWACDPDAEGPDPSAVPSTSVTPRVGEGHKGPEAQSAAASRGPVLTPTGAVTPPAASRSAVDFESMTKEELQVHADTHRIAGVNTSMTKDEMIRTIKKAGK